MATAYAAVVSLMHIMEPIQQYQARHLIFLDKQWIQLAIIKDSVSFFQDFLEGYSHGGGKIMEVLESRIADAAHMVEDIIETHVVDDIHDRSTNLGEKISSELLSQGLHKVKDSVKKEAKRLKEKIKFKCNEKRNSNRFSQGLKKVIEDMDLIKKEVLEMIEKCSLKDPQLRDLAPASSSSPPSREDTTMVFDEDMNYIIEKLLSEQSNRQVIPITGMAGIGKTTLAKNVYDNLSIVEYFDLRGWVTISQEYDEQKIVSRLLKETGARKGLSESLDYQSLGVELHKHLSGRRYLIVFDDMWSIEAWDKLKLYLPDNDNGSRIIVTTRISNVSNNFDSLDLYQMNLLDENKSWVLLCKKVFVQENCPPELEEIGKTIANNCKGLPLSIGVIGGLLAKSKMVLKYWEYISENTSTTISSNDEERCLEIVSLSYHHLPIHLKPCFLYMGVFPEDHEIRVSKLTRLWVAEGFLKSSREKSLEQDGKDYLKDLIDRNLISISKLGSTGNVRYCRIHDLLRDLCLREAQKAKFLHVKSVHRKIDRGAIELSSLDILNSTNSRRRVAIHLKSAERSASQVLQDLQSSSFLRSLICDSVLDSPLDNFKLLRVLDVLGCNYSEAVQLTNLRYLYFPFNAGGLPSSIYMLWNLQTLIIETFRSGADAPVEIWKMPQLRHLISNGLSLPDRFSSQMDEQDDVVLENLQTLSKVLDFRCSEQALRRIPNIVKLKLVYTNGHEKDLSDYCLNNLRHLKKLQSLYCELPHNNKWLSMLHVIEFPQSLRKLTLRNTSFYWEDISAKIGSLPHLEKLKLEFCSTGDTWNPVEGHFPKLKFLEIKAWSKGKNNLVNWTAEDAHFPRLEHLVLYSFRNLEEIPSGIGYITTLRSIQLFSCNDSVVVSAFKILEEQQSFGNEGLRLLLGGKPANMERWIENGTFESATSISTEFDS